MKTYPNDIIINPHADQAVVRRAYRAAYALVALATVLLVASVLTVAYTLIFPAMENVTVGVEYTYLESGVVETEEITEPAFNIAPTVFASVFVMFTLVALFLLRGSLAERLQRRHPDMFATASTLDGYIVEGEPDRNALWEAVTLEREARIVDVRITQACKSPGLTSSQRESLLQDEEDRDSARDLAAETLNRESHAPHAADL